MRALSAMTSAQARLADTIEKFYSAADRTSDGAMAGHAFKSAVEELDNSVQRELVGHDVRGCCLGSQTDAIACDPRAFGLAGGAVPYVHHGTAGQDEFVLSRHQ